MGKMVDFSTASETLKNFKVMLDNTVDLWEVDKIGTQVEECRGLQSNEYDYFHRTLVPSWISKHWGEGMLYDGEDLFKLLYDKYEPIFSKQLKHLGYDSQECFVSYECSAMDLESNNPPDGTFKMGFDVWKDDNSGWACFCVDYDRYNGILGYQIHDMGTSSRMHRSGEVSCTIEMGKGTFYNYKTEAPYKDLCDYYVDGGYALRLD